MVKKLSIKENLKENIDSTLLFFQPWKWDKKIVREVFKLCVLIYATCFASISLFCVSHDSHLLLTKDNYTILDYFNPFCQECVTNLELNNLRNKTDLVFNNSGDYLWDRMN